MQPDNAIETIYSLLTSRSYTSTELQKNIRLTLEMENLDENSYQMAVLNGFTLKNSQIKWSLINLLRHYESLSPWGTTNPDTFERRREVVACINLEKIYENIISFVPNLFKSTNIIRKESRRQSEKNWPNKYLMNLKQGYWGCYKRYLQEINGFDESTVDEIDSNTFDILRNLEDPDTPQAKTTKGLVVGYVQSGKTANFTGLLAKAADTNYSLIIILAGIHNILRDQTQQRIDTELLGVDRLSHGDKVVYANMEDGLKKFTTFQPTLRDSNHKIIRLTDVTSDYSQHNVDLLASSDPKLIVCKKHATILNRVILDFKNVPEKIRDEMSVLIIDDESDQATINSKKELEEYTAVSEKIGKLFKLFTRAQYVGFTATPFANVFIFPNDETQMFPDDFILSLPKPKNYMGGEEFFALDTYGDVEDYDLPPAHPICRKITLDAGSDDTNSLQDAILYFIISGAIKLWRKENFETRGPSKHHTMLIHTASQIRRHEDYAAHTLKIWKRLIRSQNFMELAKVKFHSEFIDSATETAARTLPDRFENLQKHISQSISLIEKGENGPVRVVNAGEMASDAYLDFNKGGVWKIVIGGNKLSRGFTVQGLTVSYFRRIAANADTLIQMARWFGYRPGYRDLVRLYISTKEPKGRTFVNLFTQFQEAIVMETDFRNFIKRYSDELTPRSFVPAVKATGIMPTADAKMHWVDLKVLNLSDESKEPTHAPTQDTLRKKNIESFHAFQARANKVNPSFDWAESEYICSGADYLTLLNQRLNTDTQSGTALEEVERDGFVPIAVKHQLDYLTADTERARSRIRLIVPKGSTDFIDFDGKKHAVFIRSKSASKGPSRYLVFSTKKERNPVKQFVDAGEIVVLLYKVVERSTGDTATKTGKKMELVNQGYPDMMYAAYYPAQSTSNQSAGNFWGLRITPT
jgi:hypothetical protein